MKKRIVVCLLVAALLLAGCGNTAKAITAEEAQTIAFEHAGFSADQVSSIHNHIVTENGIPCYSVHFSANGTDYSYVIAAADGEVISGGEGSGH